MVLLDEYGTVRFDEDQPVSEQIKESVRKTGRVYKYAGADLLYRRDERGGLSIAYLSKPKYHLLHLKEGELVAFQLARKVATDKAVVRDIGAGMAHIYLDGCGFKVPLRVLT